MKALLYVTAVSLIGFAANASDEFCQQYPDAPVCLQPSAPGKTFCQDYPDNPACSSLNNAPATADDSSGSQVTAPDSTPTVPVAPNETQPSQPADQAAPQQRTNIVIVTDQPGAASAQAIKNTILSTAPFSCMNLKIEIREVTREQLNCNPRMSQPRLLACNSDTRELANRIRREINDGIEVPREQQQRRNFFQRVFGGGRRHQARDAEIALVVVDYNEWAGAGWDRTPLVSSRLDPRGSIHEMLHGMGYHDEYVEGGNNVGGTIMRSIGGNIPVGWWPTISNYLHVPTPTTATCTAQ